MAILTIFSEAIGWLAVMGLVIAVVAWIWIYDIIRTLLNWILTPFKFVRRIKKLLKRR